MIGMSRTDCRVIWATCLIAAGRAGCCKASGPNPKCGLTPPNRPGFDGGTDGPIACGTEICDNGKVCCFTKAPLMAAACIAACGTDVDCPINAPVCQNVSESEGRPL